jgi:replicative DNA helicase
MANNSKQNRVTTVFRKTSDVTNKLPPQNIEAEQSLLGALLIDKDAIVSVAEILTYDDFYKSEQHGSIYMAILELFEKREPIDLVTVTEKLRQSGSLDKVGGSAYLAELVNKVPTAAHVESYARIIREHSVRRRLISNSTKFIDMAYDEGVEVSSVLEDAEQSIFAISQQHVKRDFIHLKDAIAQSFDRLDELQKTSGKLRGVPTGFRDLDAKLAGMQNSNLIIFAARPGMGKTSFALNIAQHASVVAGLPVGIFSLEMSQEELVDRLLVAQADIDAWKLKTGRLDDKDFDRLSHAMGQLAEAPIFIDDTPGLSMSEMRTKARRLQAEHGLKLLVVDYLQLIKGRNLENRVQEVSEISQGLKNLARELKIPVFALSQLSRAVESRGVKKPQLADLRESGAIEQDADVVMFIYREEAENFEAVKLDIQKHRNGSTGEIDLIFRGDRMKFYGMEKTRRVSQPSKEPPPKTPAAAAA